MTYVARYAADAPERAELDAGRGDVLLEFGADWCPHCQGAQPAIAAALGEFPTLTHVKVEDGSGRPLGRSYRVKVWPCLILLRNGSEIGRLLRPTRTDEVLALLRGDASPTA